MENGVCRNFAWKAVAIFIDDSASAGIRSGNGRSDKEPTTGTVLSLMDGGMGAAEAVKLAHEEGGGMTAGCNPAHLCAPRAMAHFLSDDELEGCALREAMLTHQNPLAGDVAAAVAVLYRALIRGEPRGDALALAIAVRLQQTVKALDGDDSCALSLSGFAPEDLQSAVHFVTHHGSFTDALDASLTFAGPASYRPVLVGDVGGARWGASSIPPNVLAHACETLPRLSDVADALAHDWRERPSEPGKAKVGGIRSSDTRPSCPDNVEGAAIQRKQTPVNGESYL